jgi:predicted O-methyltransferase YrrM
MSRWFEASQYLKYFLKAKGPHGVHSPLLFRLITEVMPVRPEHRRELAPVENLRKELLKNRKSLPVMDLGAGSRVHRKGERMVCSVAAAASSSPRQLLALRNFAADTRPARVLELGTNLGLGALALAIGAPRAEVVTIEGDPGLAAMAGEHFRRLGAPGVRSLTSSFSEGIRTLREEGFRPSLVIMDGDHRYAPTMEYFGELLSFVGPDAVVWMDDIHWSPEMHRAWLELSAHPAVSCSADFFDFGILWLGPGLRKQHAVLRLPS